MLRTNRISQAHIPPHGYKVKVSTKFVQHRLEHFRQVFYVRSHGNVCASFEDERDHVAAGKEQGTWQSHLGQQADAPSGLRVCHEFAFVPVQRTRTELQTG